MSDDLMEIEEQFWLQGGDFFDEHAADETIWVLPKAHGILDHAKARELIDAEGRWDRVEFGETRSTELGDVTVLAYEATGYKDGDDGEVVYRAQCTTVYEGRKLVHHHQTALT